MMRLVDHFTYDENNNVSLLDQLMNEIENYHFITNDTLQTEFFDSLATICDNITEYLNDLEEDYARLSSDNVSLKEKQDFANDLFNKITQFMILLYDEIDEYHFPVTSENQQPFADLLNAFNALLLEQLEEIGQPIGVTLNDNLNMPSYSTTNFSTAVEAAKAPSPVTPFIPFINEISTLLTEFTNETSLKPYLPTSNEILSRFTARIDQSIQTILDPNKNKSKRHINTHIASVIFNHLSSALTDMKALVVKNCQNVTDYDNKIDLVNLLNKHIQQLNGVLTRLYQQLDITTISINRYDLFKNDPGTLYDTLPSHLSYHVNDISVSKPMKSLEEYFIYASYTKNQKVPLSFKLSKDLLNTTYLINPNDRSELIRVIVNTHEDFAQKLKSLPITLKKHEYANLIYQLVYNMLESLNSYILEANASIDSELLNQFCSLFNSHNDEMATRLVAFYNDLGVDSTQVKCTFPVEFYFELNHLISYGKYTNDDIIHLILNIEDSGFIVDSIEMTDLKKNLLEINGVLVQSLEKLIDTAKNPAERVAASVYHHTLSALQKIKNQIKDTSDMFTNPSKKETMREILNAFVDRANQNLVLFCQKTGASELASTLPESAYYTLDDISKRVLRFTPSPVVTRGFFATSDKPSPTNNLSIISKTLPTTAKKEIPEDMMNAILADVNAEKEKQNKAFQMLIQTPAQNNQQQIPHHSSHLHDHNDAHAITATGNTQTHNFYGMSLI